MIGRMRTRSFLFKKRLPAISWLFAIEYTLAFLDRSQARNVHKIFKVTFGKSLN